MTITPSYEPSVAILDRIGAAFSAQPWFWAFFLFGLACVTVSSLEAFRRRWLRSVIAGVLAIECGVILCGAYVQ